MSEQARTYLPDESVSARAYDFVKSRYRAGIPWEQARDEVHQRYQVEEQDGYDITSRNMDRATAVSLPALTLPPV